MKAAYYQGNHTFTVEEAEPVKPGPEKSGSMWLMSEFAGPTSIFITVPWING